MNTVATSPNGLRRSCAVALLAGIACASQAQTANGRVRAVPQPAAPVAVAPGTPGAALPSPTGLPSPLPSPAGLNSQFPAGLPSPLPAPAGLSSTPAPGTALSSTPIAPLVGRAGGGVPAENAAAAATNVMGAGYGGVAAAQPSAATGGGPYTPVQIAQSFITADANRDGELTRAEAQRLTIMPYSFDEMDRNHDGILTRFEYEDAFGR